MNTPRLLSRRHFIGCTAGLVAVHAARAEEAASGVPLIGICSGFDSAEKMKAGGAQYLEENFQKLTQPNEPDEKAGGRVEAAAAAALPVYACNGFLPGSLKSVGPAADHDGIVKFASAGFRRAQRAGGKVVVFGSGGSRQIPDGFAREDAVKQMIALGRRLAPEAEKCGIVVAIEPLNRGECNFLNRVSEIAEVVEAVDHPALKITADLYHMAREEEGPAEFAKSVRHVRHLHLAEKAKRTCPGDAGDDFRPMFAVLKKAGYAGRISFECGWKNQAEQLPRAVAIVREQWARA